MQLHQDADKAGSGTLTLIVEDLEAEISRLPDLSPGEIGEADYTRICRFSDPDGNLVVLAQPR